jgi:hypothetical protein
MLLSELPDIANIEQWEEKGDILRHIPVGSLDKITHVSLKCPTTINNNLRQYSRDLQVLTAFLALRVLDISYLDYHTYV